MGDQHIPSNQSLKLYIYIDWSTIVAICYIMLYVQTFLSWSSNVDFPTVDQYPPQASMKDKDTE